jgi:hypothetical protein
LGSHIGQDWRRLDPGRSGWKAIASGFLVGEEREAYLSGEPTNDDRFIGVFAHELEHSGSHTPEDTMAVARELLPDVLSYDPREPVRFPQDGRALTDDVVDDFLSILTNGEVTGDKVGPHADVPRRLKEKKS